MRTPVKMLLFGRGLTWEFLADFSKMPDQSFNNGDTFDGQVGTFQVYDNISGGVRIEGGKLVFPGDITGTGFTDYELKSVDSFPNAGEGFCVSAVFDGINMRGYGPGLYSSFKGRYTIGNWGSWYSWRIASSTPSSVVALDVNQRATVIQTSRHQLVYVDGRLHHVFDNNETGTATPRAWHGRPESQGSDFYVKHFCGLYLPANGYSVWERDFSEVTDSLSAPASGTEFARELSNLNVFSYTYESGVSVYDHIFYTDADNYVYIKGDPTGDRIAVRKNIDGVVTTIAYSANGVLVDGVKTTWHSVIHSGKLYVWIDGDLLVDGHDISDIPQATIGKVFHTLTTNDIELTTHPYPALGPAASRVVCPQSGDTEDCPTDCQVILKGVTLPTSGSITHAVRYVDDNNQVYIEADSAGNLYLKQVVSGTTTTLISGTMTDGEDIQVHIDGSLGRLWHGTTTLTDTTAITHTSGSTAKRTDSSDGWMEWAACWPVDPSSNLPKALK